VSDAARQQFLYQAELQLTSRNHCATELKRQKAWKIGPEAICTGRHIRRTLLRRPKRMQESPNGRLERVCKLCSRPIFSNLAVFHSGRTIKVWARAPRMLDPACSALT